MMRRRRSNPPAVLGAVLIVAMGCDRAGNGPNLAPQELEVRQATARAQAASRKLMETLKGELEAALRGGEPQDALRVCASAAQPLTTELAETEGVRIRRTALRLRNPRNAPDDWERRGLETWAEAGAPAGARTEVVSGPSGPELRYLEPILLGPVCETCHGPEDQLSGEVRAALAAEYPEDRATGFQAGDLRGAISVRVSLE